MSALTEPEVVRVPHAPEAQRRNGASFALVTAVAFTSVFVPPTSAGLGIAIIGVGGALGALALLWLAPNNRWSSGAAPLLLFPFIAAARTLDGSAGTGWTPLLIVPLLWVVLYGSLTMLRVTAVLASAVFVVPWLLVGPPAWQSGDWRAAILWVLCIWVLFPLAQQKVKALRAAVDEQAVLAGELSSVLRAATEHSVIAVDLHGIITLFSPGAERMTGWSAQEMVGTASPLVLHDFTEIAETARRLGVPPGMEALINEVGNGAAATRRWTYHRRAGDTIDVKSTVTRIMHGETHAGWIIISRDVSDETSTHKALVAAERRWRTMLDHLPDITVMVIDSDLKYRFSAGAGLRKQGWETLDGLTVVGASGEEAALILTPVYEAALRGESAKCEVPASFTGAALAITAVPLPVEDEEPPQALVMAIDVTELRDRERAVIASRDFSRRLFDEAPHGKVLFDARGDVAMINPALCELLETSATDIVGRHIDRGALVGLLTGRELDDLVHGVTHRLRVGRTLRLAPAHETHVEVAAVGIRGPQDSERLVLVTVVDVSERKRFETQLQHLARHDALTGLVNRRVFDEELSAHLERCRRYGAKGSLMMIDLDNFKIVNDALGHGAGDQLIISIAAILRRRMRTSDVVARLGGDEFAILLPVADRGAAETVAADLLNLIRSTISVLDGTQPRKVTASLGAVVIRDTTVSASELLATADMTMYDAKEAGRDQYVVYDPAEYSMPRTSARLAWAARIEHALDNDRFQVHAQPILDVASNTFTGAELLIRMVEDNGELIMPGRFLYVAERSDLITRIDHYMLGQAAAILSTINTTHPDFAISVNLSGRSVGNPSISDLIATLAREHRFRPGNLILEITETTAVSDIAAARAFGDQMRALGCQFALDDFGAGFGSFYYLKHLVFDYVKIDGEFVSNIVDNPPDQLIVSSIVEIAHGLGKQVTAEFVKDDATLVAVAALGVDKAQGYHLSRPVTIPDLTTMITTGSSGAT